MLSVLGHWSKIWVSYVLHGKLQADAHTLAESVTEGITLQPGTVGREEILRTHLENNLSQKSNNASHEMANMQSVSCWHHCIEQYRTDMQQHAVCSMDPP